MRTTTDNEKSETGKGEFVCERGGGALVHRCRKQRAWCRSSECAHAHEQTCTCASNFSPLLESTHLPSMKSCVGGRVGGAGLLAESAMVDEDVAHSFIIMGEAEDPT